MSGKNYQVVLNSVNGGQVLVREFNRRVDAVNSASKVNKFGNRDLRRLFGPINAESSAIVTLIDGRPRDIELVQVF